MVLSSASGALSLGDGAGGTESARAVEQAAAPAREEALAEERRFIDHVNQEHRRAAAPTGARSRATSHRLTST